MDIQRISESVGQHTSFSVFQFFSGSVILTHRYTDTPVRRTTDKLRHRIFKPGFTLIELLLVMGIVATLFGISAISFFGTQGNSLVAQGAGVLVADLRSQQTKAMTGLTVGGTPVAGYGIHFESDSYILFGGDTYSAVDPNNIEVGLPSGTSVTANNFPAGNVVFLRASGEVDGFSSGQDYVEISANGSGTTTRVRVNKMGVVVEGI